MSVSFGSHHNIGLGKRMRVTRVRSEIRERRRLLARPFSRVRRALGRLRKPDDWHWFDHPEMQARIAEAEEDLREGRVKQFDTREAALAYLDGLA